MPQGGARSPIDRKRLSLWDEVQEDDSGPGAVAQPLIPTHPFFPSNVCLGPIPPSAQWHSLVPPPGLPPIPRGPKRADEELRAGLPPCSRGKGKAPRAIPSICCNPKLCPQSCLPRCTISCYSPKDRKLFFRQVDYSSIISDADYHQLISDYCYFRLLRGRLSSIIVKPNTSDYLRFVSDEAEEVSFLVFS